MARKIFQSILIALRSIILHLTHWKTQLNLQICEVRSNPIAYTFYTNIWIVSALGVLPLHVALYDRSYVRLTPVRGLRRWFNVVAFADVFIYFLFFVCNCWYTNLDFFKDGMVKMDALLLAAASALLVTALSYAKLHSQNSLVVVRDQLNALFRSFSENHLQGQQLYRLYNKEFSLIVLLGLFPFAIPTVPCLTGVFMFLIRGSPSTFTYYTARDSVWMYIVGVHDWLVVTFAGLYIFGNCACLFEGTVTACFYMRALRSINLKKLTWKQKRKLHAALELAVDETNRTLGPLAPFFVTDALLLSCLWLTIIIKILGNIWTGVVPLHMVEIVFMCTVALVGTLVSAFCSLRCMESLNTESKAFITEIQNQGCADEKQRQRMRGSFRQLVSPRYFTRRPLAAKLSIFMLVQSGLGVRFLEAVVNYTMELILMVDASHPVMILRPRIYV